jgi:hypothetical protein
VGHATSVHRGDKAVPDALIAALLARGPWGRRRPDFSTESRMLSSLLLLLFLEAEGFILD